jgi:hypothetical protein
MIGQFGLFKFNKMTLYDVHEEEEGLRCDELIFNDAGCSGFTDNFARAHKRGEDGKDDMWGGGERRRMGSSTITQKKCMHIDEQSHNSQILKQ